MALKRERKMRVFQPDTYLVVDYGERTIRIGQREPAENEATLPNISFEERSVGDEDALEEEIRAFVHSVYDRSTPIVSGLDGLQALEEAERIVKSLEIP